MSAVGQGHLTHCAIAATEICTCGAGSERTEADVRATREKRGLVELAVKLERATGQDNRLDCLIHETLRLAGNQVFSVTGHVDHALVLLEKVLPDHLVCALTQATIDPKFGDVRRYSDNRWHAMLAHTGPWLTEPNIFKRNWPSGFAPSPALALCLAIVRALIAQIEGPAP